jgi:hypothetical protein
MATSFGHHLHPGIAMNEVTEAPPKPTAAWRRRVRRLRWFLAEFLVVVSGVMVALALTSWAGERRDLGREQAYLRQLSTDLAANEASLQEYIALHRNRAEAAARVLHRFWLEDPSADDTLVADLSLPRGNARYRPILGTAEALISTGDLNLIRSDPLRASVLAYVEGVNFSLADVHRYEETYFRPAVTALFRTPHLTPFTERHSTDHAVAARPTKVERVPFPTSLDDVLRDRNVFDAYNQLLVAHRNPWRIYNNLLEETQALKAQVDAEIHR